VSGRLGGGEVAALDGRGSAWIRLDDAISMSVNDPGVARRFGRLGLASVAAVGLAMLGLAVRTALLRRVLAPGAASIVWGLGFALYLWFGGWALGLGEAHAIPFALVAGAAIALFVYLRGAGLEGPAAARPGVWQGRLVARWRSARDSRVPYQPYLGKTRELAQARVALEFGAYAMALAALRHARRVAIAQRKLDELVEARELVGALSMRSTGRIRQASNRLARKVNEGFDGFPAEALASAGVRVEPEPRPDPLPASREGRPAPTGEPAPGRTRELDQARAALAEREFGDALITLREARRVAVAQRKLDELLEVEELVRALSNSSSGRTRSASDRLARKVEAGLRTFD
jgi:hypothetical protein